MSLVDAYVAGFTCENETTNVFFPSEANRAKSTNEATCSGSGRRSAPPPGSAAFRLTLENLEFTASGGPAVATVPVIEVHPQAQSAVLGGGVTFSVVASGTPAPSYQWRKDGTALAGATGASYTISPTNASHAGAYTVLVSNSAGSVVSNPARLAWLTGSG